MPPRPPQVTPASRPQLFHSRELPTFAQEKNALPGGSQSTTTSQLRAVKKRHEDLRVIEECMGLLKNSFYESCISEGTSLAGYLTGSGPVHLRVHG